LVSVGVCGVEALQNGYQLYSKWNLLNSVIHLKARAISPLKALAEKKKDSGVYCLVEGKVFCVSPIDIPSLQKHVVLRDNTHAQTRSRDEVPFVVSETKPADMFANNEILLVNPKDAEYEAVTSSLTKAGFVLEVESTVTVIGDLIYNSSSDQVMIRKPNDPNKPFIITDCTCQEYLTMYRRDSLSLLIGGSIAMFISSYVAWNWFRHRLAAIVIHLP